MMEIAMTCQRKLQKKKNKKVSGVLITLEKTQEYFEEVEGEIYYVKVERPVEYYYVGKQALAIA